MRKLVCGILLLVFAHNYAVAQEIAVCGSLKGTARYHATEDKPSEWIDDYLNGATVLNKIGDKEFDILYTDLKGIPKSSVQRGARIFLIRRSASDIAILSVDGDAIETYRFYKEESGSLRYDYLMSRFGSYIFDKASVMSGECSSIDFHFE